MHNVQVIDDPEAATAALLPVRSRLLAELVTPASAAALATRIGLPRQKINYHLRALESHGLVHVAETRRWGGLTERLLVASASSYVISAEALGPAAADPERTLDRLSAGYLVALAARVIREVGELLHLAHKAEKHLATLSIDTEIRFASPAARAAFTQDLTRAVAELAARYHEEAAPAGRLHRLVVVAHPTLSPPPGKE